MVRDIVVNIALYIPLGAAAHLVFRKSRLPLFSFYGPVLLGFLLSTVIELTQLFTPVRDSSIVDLVTNVIGSACGMLIAVLFEAMIERRRPGGFHTAVADRGALMLIFCWAASFVFPLFPVISPYQLAKKLSVFVHSPVFDATQLATALAAWFAAGLLTSRLWTRRSAGLLLLAIPAQFFIAGQQPLRSELLGATAGLLLSLSGLPAMASAIGFLIVLALRGLAPFHLSAKPTAFSWIPFIGLLNGEWQTSLLVLVSKTFHYGAAIWLLRAAGLRLRYSAILVAVILAAVEIAQTRLPGRTPESMDPILAILLGFTLAILARSDRMRDAQATPSRETEKQSQSTI
jgi:VanZ family protein